MKVQFTYASIGQAAQFSVFGVLALLCLAAARRATAPTTRPAGEVDRKQFDIRAEGTLKVGDAAPDFCLKTPDGKSEVRLSDFKGKKPVVLVFGSYTCPPFRNHVGSLNATYEKHKDNVAQYLVYILEAHPDDGWQAATNAREQIHVMQPKTDQERAEVTQTCVVKASLKFPAVVDGIDNKTATAYAAWPDRLYIVGKDGRIAYKGEVGPGGFDADDMSRALEKLLVGGGSAPQETKDTGK